MTVPQSDKRETSVIVPGTTTDIAMTELFGGFPPVFYEAYGELGLSQSGYDDRKDLYNLYQLLNHLNMFGTGYLPAVKRILMRYAG